MKSPPSLAKKLFVTACAFTRTTEFFTRYTGIGMFLPQLFALRFANMLGVPGETFDMQMSQCHSFDDEKWTTHWREIAHGHLDRAHRLMGALGGPLVDLVKDEPTPGEVEALSRTLGISSAMFCERAPRDMDALHTAFRARSPAEQHAAQVLDDLVKAMGYLTVASWPGWSVKRLAAYRDAQRIFDWLLFALAPQMGLSVEKLRVEAQGDVVTAYAVFPQGTHKVPAVLLTNGLEGSIQELLLPSLKFRRSGLGMIAMEMPGTFAYRQPMSEASEGIYGAVIDQVLAHPRVDADAFAMAGVSFGAYWSTRMAAKDKRIRAVVSNGGPYHHSFKPSRTLGMPEIILGTMAKTLRASSSLDLGHKLHAMSIQHLYGQISQPLLAINGESDTLLSTQDTVDLAHGAGGELLLYPGDDHCAMAHYTEWLEFVQDWIMRKLRGL